MRRALGGPPRAARACTSRRWVRARRDRSFGGRDLSVDPRLAGRLKMYGIPALASRSLSDASVAICSCPRSAPGDESFSLSPPTRPPRGPSRLSWGASLEQSALAQVQPEESSPKARTRSFEVHKGVGSAPCGPCTPWKLDTDEESARRWMDALPAEQQGWVAHMRHEGPKSCMEEVLALRTPRFSRSGQGIKLNQKRPEATQTADLKGTRTYGRTVLVRVAWRRPRQTPAWYLLLNLVPR